MARRDTITQLVRDYIDTVSGDFTKRDCAEAIFGKALHNVPKELRKSTLAYVGNLILWEKKSGSIVEVGEVPVSSCVTAKVYRRVGVSRNIEIDVQASMLMNVSTAKIVAELNRRFG